MTATEEQIKAVGDLIRDVAERAEAAMRAGRSVVFDTDNEIMDTGESSVYHTYAAMGRRTYTIRIDELGVAPVVP